MVHTNIDFFLKMVALKELVGIENKRTETEQGKKMDIYHFIKILVTRLPKWKHQRS